MLVLDSGAVTRLAERSARAAELVAALRAEGFVATGGSLGGIDRMPHW